MGLLESGWKWKCAGRSLSDAQLRRQVQKQISHVLCNAPLVARPSLPGPWSVAGGWGQAAPLAGGFVCLRGRRGQLTPAASGQWSGNLLEPGQVHSMGTTVWGKSLQAPESGLGTW